MSDKSILLGLDGSAQSRYAAEIAWAMAKAGGYKVDAQHVVDSLAAWDFLNFDIAGFIGSGPYFEAHETMRNSLETIGQNLIDVYRQLAQQNGIAGEAHLDEGTTIREICWRAKDHELVVLGQRSTGMQSPNEDQRKLPRRSIAETLTHYCPKPLLIVQDRAKLWSKVRIMLGDHKVPADLLNSCVDFVKSVGMEPSVRYVYTNPASANEIDKTSPDGLRVSEDVTKSVPSLAGQKVEVRSTPDLHEYFKADAEQEPETLLVVPVMDVKGTRHCSLGPTPDVIVRYLSHPAVLFWMYGQPPESASESEKTVTSAV